MSRIIRRCRPVMAAALGLAAMAAIGLSNAPAALAASPSFVQQVSGRAHAASVVVTPGSAVSAGDRMVVEVGVWNTSHATASSVTDSAGNSYTELTHFAASDGTELSVWSAPITAGGGSKPTITARASSSADIGVAAVEYAGLSAAAGAETLDVQAHTSGTTGAAATVGSGATPPAIGSGELAIGFYVDSGFGDTLTTGSGYTGRVKVAPTSDMELMVEDQLVGQGATPAATAGTGSGTVWLMATLVLVPASPGAPTTPGAPSGVSATPGNASASVTWTAPYDGGAPIDSYTVTAYAAGVAQSTKTVSGSPLATSATVPGLTNGTSYTFTVSATNAVGTGPESTPSNAVTPSNANPQGKWGPVLTWPIVAVHSVLMHNGKLLQWDGWDTPEPTEVYDPAAQSFTTVNAPSSNFCAGNVQLPNGRIMTIGGYGITTTGNQGIVDTSIFDPATQTWNRVANMHVPRWYPDVVELADGRYVAISGNSTSSGTWADTPEVYDPSANTWMLLSNVSTSQVHEEEYPFSYLAPNGKVFTIGPSEDQSFFLDVGNQTWTPVGSSGVVNGSSVMYRPGKILYSGGAASVINTTPARAGSAIIDLNAASPAWQPAPPMNNPRVYHTLTMLADGRVLAVGGEATSDQSQVTTGVLPSEIWDPATGTWTVDASMSAARNYHSTAVLMPDGTVLVAGGGHEDSLGGPGQYSAQVYSPSYLFNGARPTITSAPASSTYGANLTISTPDAASISAVNLVSLGSDTHQADMSQHFVPLSFTAGSGSLTVQAPASTALAPPGYYMMFIVNNLGVPSVAAIVQMTPAPPTVPGAPTAVTATPGNGSASVTWSAPANGGSTITSYTITPYAAGVAQQGTTITGNPPGTSATITGLTNGTPYTFTVTAKNGIGTGPSSSPSTPVTPTATTGTAPSVDAHVSVNATGSTATTPAFSTTHASETLIAFVATDGPNTPGSQTATVSGAGLTWTLVGRANTQPGTAEIWSATTTSALSAATVTSKETRTSYPQMLTVMSFANSSGIGAFKTASAASGAPSLTLTTTKANSLIYGVGTDWDNARARTPGANQTVTDQWVATSSGDTYWVQGQNNPVAAPATATTIYDTAPTNDRWDLTAVEVGG